MQVLAERTEKFQIVERKMVEEVAPTVVVEAAESMMVLVQTVLPVHSS